MRRTDSPLLLGAIAGFVGTAAMTAAMSRLHRALPRDERYPLPPRELVEPLAPTAPDGTVKDLALAAHFGFGAGAGALIAAAAPRLGPAGWSGAGVGVWALSYLGWAPLLMGMEWPHRHPARRNALMIGVHLVWGAVAGLTLQELSHARDTMLAVGPLKDRRQAGRRNR